MSDKDPQVEHGYTKWAWELEWALGHAGLSARERLFVSCVARFTYALGKKAASIPPETFMQYTGFIRQHLYLVEKGLSVKRIISVTKKGYQSHKTYRINKKYKTWKLEPKLVHWEPKLVTACNHLWLHTPLVKKNINIYTGKSKTPPPDLPPDNPPDYQPVDNLPYQDIINFLNEKTGKKFRHQTESTRKSIRGRFTDGYKFEDFKQVIENKVADWSGTDYEKFLTPDTLFRPSKFEKYLNETPAQPKTKRNWAY